MKIYDIIVLDLPVSFPGGSPMSALIVSGRSNDEASEKALEDIRTKVVPFLGIPQGSQVIAQVAEKHHLSIERVIQIAKNMKKRDGK